MTLKWLLKCIFPYNFKTEDLVEIHIAWVKSVLSVKNVHPGWKFFPNFVTMSMNTAQFTYLNNFNQIWLYD